MKLYEVTVTSSYLALANSPQEAKRHADEARRDVSPYDLDYNVKEIRKTTDIEDTTWLEDPVETLVYNNIGDISVKQALKMVGADE